jgi:predicted nucleic acid-binding protein
MKICGVSGMSGMIEASTSSKLYFDANVFIYAVEGSDDIAGQLRTLFELLRSNLDLAVTSELTLAEVLPKADPVRRRSYLELILYSGLFNLYPVTRDILIETADYRRIAGVSKPEASKPYASMPRLPDAIHVVTTVRAGCGRMLSFDRALKLPEGMRRLTRDGLPHLIEELS